LIDEASQASAVVRFDTGSRRPIGSPPPWSPVIVTVRAAALTGSTVTDAESPRVRRSPAIVRTVIVRSRMRTWLVSGKILGAEPSKARKPATPETTRSGASNSL